MHYNCIFAKAIPAREMNTQEIITVVLHRELGGERRDARFPEWSRFGRGVQSSDVRAWASVIPGLRSEQD